MALFLTGVSASQAACGSKDKQALHTQKGGWWVVLGFFFFLFIFFPPPHRCACSIVANPVTEVAVDVKVEKQKTVRVR